MVLFIVALVILVAIFGFWDTLGAVFGGIAIVVLLLVLAVAFAVWSGYRALSAWRDRRT